MDLSTGAVASSFARANRWGSGGALTARHWRCWCKKEGATPQLTQWLMWRPEGSFRSERFTISPTFGVAYVPFFDQFAQSVTPVGRLTAFVSSTAPSTRQATQGYLCNQPAPTRSCTTNQ